MSRFTKETFPEKWCIEINAFNQKIVGEYFSIVSICYSNWDFNDKKYLCSHNSSGQPISNKAEHFFASKNPRGIEINLEEFIKYVLKQPRLKEDHSQLIKLLNDVL